MSKRVIEGWATKYDVVDTDNERIVKSAFKNQKKTVPLLFNHQPDTQIGTAELIPVDEGVRFKAYIDETGEQADATYKLLKGGNLDKVSIGFDTDETKANGDITDILSGDIKELSVVPVPANGKAVVEKVKSYGGEIDNMTEKNKADKTAEDLSEIKQLLIDIKQNKDAEDVSKNEPMPESKKAAGEGPEGGEGDQGMTPEEIKEFIEETVKKILEDKDNGDAGNPPADNSKSIDDFLKTKSAEKAIAELLVQNPTRKLEDSVIQNAIVDIAEGAGYKTKAIDNLDVLAPGAWKDQAQMYIDSSILWKKLKKFNGANPNQDVEVPIDIATLQMDPDSRAKIHKEGTSKKFEKNTFVLAKLSSDFIYKRKQVPHKLAKKQPWLVQAFLEEIPAKIAEMIDELVLFGSDYDTDPDSVKPFVGIVEASTENVAPTASNAGSFAAMTEITHSDSYLKDLDDGVASIWAKGNIELFATQEFINNVKAELRTLPGESDLAISTSDMHRALFFEKRAKEQNILAIGLVPSAYGYVGEDIVDVVQKFEFDNNTDEILGEILASGAPVEGYMSFVIKKADAGSGDGGDGNGGTKKTKA